jgi:hypothetical protein
MKTRRPRSRRLQIEGGRLRLDLIGSGVEIYPTKKASQFIYINFCHTCFVRFLCKNWKLMTHLLVTKYELTSSHIKLISQQHKLSHKADNTFSQFSETELCRHAVYTGFPSVHDVTVESSHNTQNIFNLHRLSKHKHSSYKVLPTPGGQIFVESINPLDEFYVRYKWPDHSSRQDQTSILHKEAGSLPYSTGASFMFQ